MKSRKAAGLLAGAFGGILALIWAAWLVAVPSELIIGKIKKEMQATRAKLGFEGFRKGLFFSIRADGLRIINDADGREILYLEDIKAGLNALSVFSLNPHLDFSAVLSDGSVKGRAAMDGSLSVSVEGVDLSGMGIDNLITGLRAGGMASLDIKTLNGEGEVRFHIDRLRFLPYSYMGFSLPLDLLREARGLVVVENGVAKVESATIEGDGIYARVRGSIDGRNVDMRLELMPSEELERAQPYFGMLQSYRVAKGLYDIPLRASY